MDYKKIIKTGYNLHIIKTKKFKTNQISIKFRNKMDKDTVTVRSLLPFVIKAKSDKYSSKKHILEKLESLYGATLSSRVNKFGQSNIISLDLKIPNDKFIKSESKLLQESILFLNDLIFMHNEFSKDVLEEEKRLLMNEFESEFDNKTKYALNKLFENMLENENYKFRSMGIKEEVDKISLECIKNAYNDMLTNDEINVFICGDISDEDIKVLENNFNFKGQNSIDVNIIDNEEKIITYVNDIKEYKTINQGKLNFGFRTKIRIGDDLHYALGLYNGILGGNPNSKLFQNVREKNSLAYYCASGFDSKKGLLFIYAGIEPNKYEKVYEIVLEQMDLIKKGDFTDKELEVNKIGAINELIESMDSQGNIISKAYVDTLRNKKFNIEHILKGIESVTKEQIIQVANMIELDSTYFLTSKEEL